MSTFLENMAKDSGFQLAKSMTWIIFELLYAQINQLHDVHQTLSQHILNWVGRRKKKTLLHSNLPQSNHWLQKCFPKKQLQCMRLRIKKNIKLIKSKHFHNIHVRVWGNAEEKAYKKIFFFTKFSLSALCMKQYVQ